MPERTRRIRHRAHALFRKENTSPIVILDSTYVEGGVAGHMLVTEEVRRSYYERAEQELLSEGKIKPLPAARKTG
jgi:hypothetical protein